MGKKFRHPSSLQGFTLIELLTVIGIIVVMSTIVVSIVVITLRGSTKTDMLETARQNGGIALTQIVKTIRYGERLSDPASCMPQSTSSSITVVSLKDQQETTLSCTDNTISSNSASLIDNTNVIVKDCVFTCTQRTLSSPPTITIDFSLAPKQTSDFIEKSFSIPFQSSVTMRNFTR